MTTDRIDWSKEPEWEVGESGSEETQLYHRSGRIVADFRWAHEARRAKECVDACRDLGPDPAKAIATLKALAALDLEMLRAVVKRGGAIGEESRERMRLWESILDLGAQGGDRDA